MEDNRHFGNKITGRCLIYKGGALIKKQFIEKIIGNVSDWRFYTGGALIEVANPPVLTVLINSNIQATPAMSTWHISILPLMSK